MPTEALWLDVPVVPGRAAVTVVVEPLSSVDGQRPGDDHLSVAERRRQAMMAPRRAAEFARGRSLLRRVVGAVYGIPASSVALTVESAGRPRLPGRCAGVSLSHTDSHTAAAVWPDGDLGIDVEAPPDDLDLRLVARCCHHPGTAVASLPDQARKAAFARVWTVQEACAKAVGLGLAARFWHIPVDPTAAGGAWGDVHWVALDELAPTGLAVAVRPGPANRPGPATRPGPTTGAGPTEGPRAHTRRTQSKEES